MFSVPVDQDAVLDTPARSSRLHSRTTTVEALLGLLTLRPMSGYELQRTISRTIGNFWQESFGQIYPALRRLVAEGLAQVEERGEPESARLRKVYRLTEAGERRVRQWLAEPCERQVIRDELLLKMFFGSSVPKDEMIEHLERHKALLEADLARYRAAETVIPVRQQGSPSVPYFLIAVRHGVATAEAKLRWCEESIAALLAITDGAANTDV